MVTPRLLRLVNVYQALTAALLAGACLLVWPEGAFAVLAGAVVMGSNLVALRAVVGKLAQGSSRGLYSALFMLKLFALFGAMFVLLVVMKLDPLGMMLGLSTLFTGVALGMAHQSFSPRLPAPQA